jgi:hypothetical protein
MMVMAAIVFTQLWNWKKWISAGLIIFFITTNWLNIFPFNLSTTKAITKSVSQQSDWERLNQPHCYLLDFLRQLFTPYNGTVETIVNYLKKNASPDNVVVINSEVEVLAFYTHLTVLHPFELKLRHLKPEQIKWVIDRGYTTPENKILTDLKLDPNQYETINLGVPNSFFNNSPDLSNFRESWSTHFFTPPNYYQPLLIFKRK